MFVYFADLIGGLFLQIVVISFLLSCIGTGNIAVANELSLSIKNFAGKTVEVFWYDIFSTTDSEELPLFSMGIIPHDKHTSIHTTETHKFKVAVVGQEDNYIDIVKGPGDESFDISWNHESNQLEFNVGGLSDYKESIEQKRYTRSISEMPEIVDECLDLYPTEDTGSRKKLAECIAHAYSDDMVDIDDRKSKTETFRNLISSRLRNYTCSDPMMDSSIPTTSYDYYHAPSQKSYQVDSHFDLDNAKIWVVNDFISDEECNILMNHGRPLLKRATVAAEDGTSIFSESRKASQAMYNIHQNKKDPLQPLFNRVLDMTNHHAGYKLKPEGQEEFTIIHYNAGGDEYVPHCDGTCDGSKHILRGRVATAVLYCEAADVGGATTFTNADIFVKPKKGMATFFSYKGKNGKMDEGYTEHSGCPIVEGEKWITTVWMREGVSLEDPWMLYDPSGIRIL